MAAGKEIDFLICFSQHYHRDSFSGLYPDDIVLRHFVVAFSLWWKWSSPLLPGWNYCVKLWNYVGGKHKTFRRIKGQNVNIKSTELKRKKTQQQIKNFESKFILAIQNRTISQQHLHFLIINLFLRDCCIPYIFYCFVFIVVCTVCGMNILFEGQKVFPTGE